MELRNVKILLIPTKEQRQKFYDFSYYADLMYNQAIDWNNELYDSEGIFYSRFDLINMLPAFKKEHPEFASVDSFILNVAVTDFRTALNRMKCGAKYPRYKKIGKKLSFGTRNDRLKVFKNKVKISSIGVVKCKHCHWLTKTKTDEELACMSWHNPRVKFDGKYWFLSVGIEVNLTPDETTDEVIGVDLGVRKTIYTSNGITKPNINNSRKVVNLEKRKKRLQKKVSRKYELNKYGKKYIKTKNIKKTERQIRLIDRKLKYIRENYNQTITNELIALHPKRIMIEDLNVSGMLKNKHLSKSIQQQCFYRLRQLLIEKALNTMSTQIGVVDRFYPSSKTCSRCGYINRQLKSEEIYRCPKCGLMIDRDYNASINIRDYRDYKIVAN